MSRPACEMAHNFRKKRRHTGMKDTMCEHFPAKDYRRLNGISLAVLHDLDGPASGDPDNAVA